MKLSFRFLALFCAFVSFSYMHAGMLHQCAAVGASWSSLVTDSLQFKALGDQDACQVIKQESVDILRFLELENPEKIQVKCMSELLRSCIGSETCIGTHNALFVDEQWLMSLSQEQRKFVLAHEAMHLKNKDTAKTVGAYLLLFVITTAGIAYFKDKEWSLPAIGTLVLLEMAAVAAFSRYKEACADAGAERVAPHAFHNYYAQPQNETLMGKLWAWLCSWFSEYDVDRFSHS